MTPDVSVVIASHNRSTTIERAVCSVLNQSYRNLEVLVIDDGSTDDTAAKVQRISDPRIRLFCSPRNEGVSAARNRGINQSLGKWVAFQDSDDEWLPTKLEKQLAKLTVADPDCVAGYCGMLLVGGLKADPLARTSVRYIPDPGMTAVTGNILPSLLRTSFISTQTMIIRRDVLEAVEGFDEQLASLVDWDCALRVARHGSWIFVDEPLVLQRFSSDSLTHDVRRRVHSTERIVQKNLDLLASHPDILANHYRTIAGGYRRLGDTGRARHFLTAARRLRPFSAGLWAVSAYTALSGLENPSCDSAAPTGALGRKGTCPGGLVSWYRAGTKFKHRTDADDG